MPSVESLPAVLITAPDRPLHDHDRALLEHLRFWRINFQLFRSPLPRPRSSSTRCLARDR